MARLIGIAAVSFVAALAIAPRSASSGIPVTALAETQPMPSLAPVVKRISASVVSITIRAAAAAAKGYGLQDPMDDPLLRDLLGAPVVPQQQQQTFAAGSGVIIDAAKGYVVTNYHVIQDADQIDVTLVDGRQFTGELAGADPDTDIALIHITAQGLTAITLGNSDGLQVGDFVLAIGNPFGIGQTVTSGIVSGLKRNRMGLEGYEDFIQTDASINPGNSGGALVNLRGELVGINAAIVDVKGGTAGIGFAIPVNMVRAVSNQLAQFGTVERGELGFTLAALTPDLAKKWKATPGTGVLISKVDSHSAAERAGLHAGDVVTAIAGVPVQDVPDLRNRIAVLRVGDRVELSLLRAGTPLAVQAVLDAVSWKALDGAQIADLLDGALFTNSPPGALDKGVQVATVRSASNAWASGLREGDIVTSVNSRRVIGLDQFATEAGRAPAAMSLDVLRNGEKLYLQIRMHESAARKS